MRVFLSPSCLHPRLLIQVRESLIVIPNLVGGQAYQHPYMDSTARISPPNLPEIHGFGVSWAFSGSSGSLSRSQGIQWNSVGFCMALNMNKWPFLGDFKATTVFWKNLRLGWFGQSRASNGFCANDRPYHLLWGKGCPFPSSMWFGNAHHGGVGLEERPKLFICYWSADISGQRIMIYNGSTELVQF